MILKIDDLISIKGTGGGKMPPMPPGGMGGMGGYGWHGRYGRNALLSQPTFLSFFFFQSKALRRSGTVLYLRKTQSRFCNREVSREKH